MSNNNILKACQATLLALGLALVAGCKTAPSDSLTAFSTGLSAARTQSQEAFAAVNEMVAGTSVDFAAKQPTLTEASFSAGLDDQSLQAWDEILEKLAQYARDVQALTSPGQAREFGEATVNLSGELKDFATHLQQAGLINKSPSIGPAIATGFTQMGELLIRLHGQIRARQVLMQADPEVRRILQAMAEAVGASTAHGIRGTVQAHWDQQLAERKVAFLNAPDFAAKRLIASEFRDMLRRRSAQNLVLVSLRRSLLQLADVHHALSQGQNVTADLAATAIDTELQETRDLNNRFQEKLKP